jgi:hypothetical protein
MWMRAELERRLRDVSSSVSRARRDGVGSAALVRDILVRARRLSDAVPAAYDSDGAVVDAVLVRFASEFCTFIKHEFPEILTQGFEGLDLDPRYDLDAHVPDIEYTYQNAWAAEKVFAIRPAQFVDVGSLTSFVTVVSRLVPCIAVDARPTPLVMDGLSYRQGEAQCLPFDGDTVPMLTSLHACEHFGLGRYGDTLDSRGVERAIAEYTRVVEPGGHLAISLPIAAQPRIRFNSARIFTRELMIGLFDGCDVVEEAYVGSDYVTHDELLRKVRDGRILSGVCCLLLRKRL